MSNLKKRREAHKARILNLMGGACVMCEIDEFLEFHHTDPSQKVFVIGQYLGRISFERIVGEAQKCTLLCSTCHIIEHQADPDLGAIIGGYAY